MISGPLFGHEVGFYMLFAYHFPVNALSFTRN